MANARFDSVLAKKLSTFIRLSADELKWLARMQTNPITIKRGKQLTQEGESGHKAFVLQAGWACSFKLLASGSRQIISFPIAGDIVGLRSVLLRTADHSFSTITDAVVSVVDEAQLLRSVTEFPHLGAALLWAASRDEAMVVEHLVSIGRRSAIERTAHFFMELAERLTLVGLATETEFECPLSQFVLADALGLTSIHVNRVLRQLRELKLLTLRKKTVTIHDLAGLRKLAGYRGGYLNARS
jgi:CRP-like cAMP-binding protein